MPRNKSAAVLLVLALLNISQVVDSAESIHTLRIMRNGRIITEVRAEVADNPLEQAKGLMFREALPEGRGMWFIFDANQSGPFWMKNTQIPLDIIFVDNNTSIISIHKNAVPLSERPIYSRGPYRYVLEVPAGFADNYKIRPRDQIRMLTTN